LENLDLNKTVEAWADILIGQWYNRLSKFGIGYTFELENSIFFSIDHGSDGLPNAVRMRFAYYGKFVDMGVGAGLIFEDVKLNSQEQRIGKGNYRRPKPWYSKVFYSEVFKLSEILAKKYNRKGMMTIVENFDDHVLMHGKRHIQI
jgi:hypothetical protein